MKRDQCLVYLRNSNRPEASALMEKFDLLSKSEQKVVTLDILASAAGVDASTTLSLITEEAHRNAGNVATLLMSIAHPKVTKATIDAALRGDGVADRKLLHNSMGTTPVPKNTITNVDARGANMQKIQINASVPSLSDIVKLVDNVVGQ